MGQYWYPVNLDKREYINPHRLGTGLKLWEQLANHPGTGAALVILCAAMPEARGGGDLDLDANWHGPERQVPGIHNCNPGPMPDAYPEIAKQTIGRWAGDRIAFIGDYAEDTDLPTAPIPASRIYDACSDDGSPDSWKDVSSLVATVIEHELQGTYHGDGWREFRQKDAPA